MEVDVLATAIRDVWGLPRAEAGQAAGRTADIMARLLRAASDIAIQVPDERILPVVRDACDDML